ncbi:MAG: hypothetical protein AAF773_25160 [Cyanobacteria bacterium P01_D01_bin.115]
MNEHRSLACIYLGLISKVVKLSQQHLEQQQGITVAQLEYSIVHWVKPTS